MNFEKGEELTHIILMKYTKETEKIIYRKETDISDFLKASIPEEIL